MHFLHLPLSPVFLIDSSTGSPVYVLMLSIHDVRGLPRLRAHGIVPCIISLSRQLPLFPYGVTIVCYSFLALTVSNSCLFTPALLRTHSLFSLLPTKPAEPFSALSAKSIKTCFFNLSECPALAVFVGLTRWQTDWQTDRPRYSVSNNKRHLRTYFCDVVWSNNM